MAAELKHRASIANERATSPTLAAEAAFLAAVIDALVGREVAVIDVPGAFLQAEIYELDHVKCTGTMVELLLEIDWEMYGPCVTMEHGERSIYSEVLEALYGTLRVARLVWEKLSGRVRICHQPVRQLRC